MTFSVSYQDHLDLAKDLPRKEIWNKQKRSLGVADGKLGCFEHTFACYLILAFQGL